MLQEQNLINLESIFVDFCKEIEYSRFVYSGLSPYRSIKVARAQEWRTQTAAIYGSHDSTRVRYTEAKYVIKFVNSQKKEEATQVYVTHLKDANFRYQRERGFGGQYDGVRGCRVVGDAHTSFTRFPLNIVRIYDRRHTKGKQTKRYQRR